MNLNFSSINIQKRKHVFDVLLLNLMYNSLNLTKLHHFSEVIKNLKFSIFIKASFIIISSSIVLFIVDNKSLGKII
jgi:hypothetical protein